MEVDDKVLFPALSIGAVPEVVALGGIGAEIEVLTIRLRASMTGVGRNFLCFRYERADAKAKIVFVVLNQNRILDGSRVSCQHRPQGSAGKGGGLVTGF